MFCLSACMTTGGATESESLHGLWKNEQGQFFFLDESGRLSLPRRGDVSGVSWDFNGTALTLETVKSPGAELEQQRLLLQKRGLFRVEFLDQEGRLVTWGRSFKKVKQLEGTLFFRERMMLPPEVTVSVQLREQAGGPVVGQSIAAASGRSELAFCVDYLSADLKGSASVEAAVFYGSEPLFASPEGTATSLDGHPSLLLHHAVPSQNREHSLTGTYWRLKELNGKPAEMFDDQPDAHLILSEKGEATGSDGCNNFFLGWEGSENSITFTPGGSTLRICPKGEEQARAMLQMLPSVKSWSISGGHLELHSGDRLEAVFEAVEM